MNAHTPNLMNTIDGKEIKIEDRRLVDRHGVLRAGSYMHTSHGLKFFPFDPRPADVNIETIANHLACQGRYNGATRHKRFKSKIFESVAEHSVYVKRYVVEVLRLPELALEALLHDASESYIGDLIRPLKYSPEFRKPFLDLEVVNENAIGKAFNLLYPFPKEIKMADEAVTSAEVEQMIYHHPEEEWESGKLHSTVAVAPYEIQMLNPYEAKMLFLEHFYEVIAERDKYRALPPEFHIQMC